MRGRFRNLQKVGGCSMVNTSRMHLEGTLQLCPMSPLVLVPLVQGTFKGPLKRYLPGTFKVPLKRYLPGTFGERTLTGNSKKVPERHLLCKVPLRYLSKGTLGVPSKKGTWKVPFKRYLPGTFLEGTLKVPFKRYLPGTFFGRYP